MNLFKTSNFRNKSTELFMSFHRVFKLERETGGSVLSVLCCLELVLV